MEEKDVNVETLHENPASTFLKSPQLSNAELSRLEDEVAQGGDVVVGEKKIAKKKTNYKMIFHKVLRIRAYTDCIFVRFLFIFIIDARILIASCIYDPKQLVILYLSNAVIIVDLFYALWKRNGLDFYWFSISTTVYSSTMTILIILLNEFKYYENDFYCSTNRTHLGNYGKCENLKYSTCAIAEIFMVSFLISLVVARWLLPISKKLNPDAIYSQIYGYTSTAADVVDIADYMQSERFSAYYGLVKGIQLVFGLSLIQFSFSLSATKKRNYKLRGFFKFVDILFATEACSLSLALFSQAFPGFIIRLLILSIVNTRVQLSLYFFTFKNGVMIFLLIYRIVVVIYRKYKEESKSTFASNEVALLTMNNNNN